MVLLMVKDLFMRSLYAISLLAFQANHIALPTGTVIITSSVPWEGIVRKNLSVARPQSEIIDIEGSSIAGSVIYFFGLSAAQHQ